jgi:hypothetical protein
MPNHSKKPRLSIPSLRIPARIDALEKAGVRSVTS